METVSFVIPCYRSEATIEGVVREIARTMEEEALSARYDYEIVLVCDGSPDRTFEVIRSLAAGSPRIHGINFAANFGQHAALMAGLREAKGDIVICLDDDGQTPADRCGSLLDKLAEGYDAVYASYENKQHSGFRNFGSRVNDYMVRVMIGKPRDLQVTSYFAVKRFVVDEMIRYENAYPYVIGLLLRATKNIANVPVDHKSRVSGESGYTLGKLLSLWFNGFTTFSVKPLRIATSCGVLFAIAGFLYGIWTIVKHLFINPDQPVGWSSMMSVMLFTGGMVMLMLGMIGEYIGRIYVSMNAAPQYVIREKV
ncbi:MAG: glycosyltransferase family 2 protein [Butyrivibrio sp.]|nr:glycosyltransferase family 2 protein [Butyrivibrio sp.]